MEILFWIWVLTWMFKTAAQDVTYAVKGQPNPRYELKMQKARAAGQPVTGPARYGTRDWFADLYSDALVAHTEKRRAKSVKGLPVDDMLDVADVRSADSKPPASPTPSATEPEWLTPDRDEQEDQPVSVVHDDQHPYCVEPCGPTCTAGRGTYGWRCGQCGTDRSGFASEDEARADSAAHPCRPATPADARPRCNRPGCYDGRIIGTRQWPGDPSSSDTADQNCDRCGWLSSHTTGKSWDQLTEEFHNRNGEPVDTPPLATVIPLFPNPKETDMANAEITGLPTATAFADGMVNAHRAASSAGGEEYVAALRKFDVGEGVISSVATAREASMQAAAAWERVATDLRKQQTVKEAYDAVPDAGNKAFVTGE